MAGRRLDEKYVVNFARESGSRRWFLIDAHFSGRGHL